MKFEIKEQEDNNTWEVIDLPQSKNVIGSKWVYKIKYKANRDAEMFKEKLVAKDYIQKKGLDYHDTFSPVEKMVTVRYVIALVVYERRCMYQIDMYNVFLQRYLNEEVYMEMLDGFKKEGPHKVCRLINSLYGLKQALRQRNIKLIAGLINAGFKQSPHDYSLFTLKRKEGMVLVLVYVDDLLITGDSTTMICEVKEVIHQ